MSLSDYQQMEGETDDNFIQNMAIVGLMLHEGATWHKHPQAKHNPLGTKTPPTPKEIYLHNNMCWHTAEAAQET